MIENPTEQELAVKEKILKLMEEEEKERQRIASMKTIPLKELEVGGIYETTQGDTYVFLGNRKVTFESTWGAMKKEQEGNCFANIFYIEGKTTNEEVLEKVLSIYSYRQRHNIDVLKGNKKITKMIGKICLDFPLTKSEQGYFRDSKYKLTVE